MKHFIFIYLLLVLNIGLEAKSSHHEREMIVSTKQIHLSDYPEAFNPSLLKTDFGFILTFRHCLAPHTPWISYIGIVKLDHDLNVISEPKLLNTRDETSITPSQAEDARIFRFMNDIYVIYNDNIDVINPSWNERRDMYIAKIRMDGDEYFLETPLKVIHKGKYPTTNWQKNWVPFESNQKLLMAYSLNSHEILSSNMQDGLFEKNSISSFKDKWIWGSLRGGTPAILVDGSYLAFFHSSKVTSSKASNNLPMHHYYMGAYIFSSKPPYAIKKISRSPIVHEGFYTNSDYDKRVIFPGGIALVNNQIYVAYGKDDKEIWIAIMNKKELIKSLKSVDER